MRLAFSSIDRLVFAGLYRLAPGVLDALHFLATASVDGSLRVIDEFLTNGWQIEEFKTEYALWRVATVAIAPEIQSRSGRRRRHPSRARYRRMSAPCWYRCCSTLGRQATTPGRLRMRCDHRNLARHSHPNLAAPVRIEVPMHIINPMVLVASGHASCLAPNQPEEVDHRSKYYPFPGYRPAHFGFALGTGVDKLPFGVLHGG
jgi:hypothetical protein